MTHDLFGKEAADKQSHFFFGEQGLNKGLTFALLCLWEEKLESNAMRGRSYKLLQKLCLVQIG